MAAGIVRLHAYCRRFGGPTIELIVLVAVLVWMSAFGVAAALAAVRLDRTGQVWFVFGAILGPIALVLLRAAPPGLCRACGSPTRGWLNECWWCRQDVRLTTSTIARLSVPGLATGASPRRDHARPARPVRQDQTGASRFPPTPPAAPSRPSEPVGGAPTTATKPASVAPARPPSPVPAGRTETTESLGRPLAWVPATDLPDNEPVRSRSDAESSRVLASAIYVTGSTNLEPGHRYGIAVGNSRLQILGPTDIDPSRVALDRPSAGIDAQSVEGRLILSYPNGPVLAFMAVAGPATHDLAAIIVEAARGDVD